MFEKLKKYCECIVPNMAMELELIDDYFEEKKLKKKEFLLQDDKICNFVAFIAIGSIRHFHIKDGVERTCYISFNNSWITYYQSLPHSSMGKINLQAIEETTVFFIKQKNLTNLYKESSKYETFGRLMAEQVAQRAIEIAMSLSTEKPEERLQNLLEKEPYVFQRIPQKYIANFLGVSPESLSRIRKRIVLRKV